MNVVSPLINLMYRKTNRW